MRRGIKPRREPLRANTRKSSQTRLRKSKGEPMLHVLVTDRECSKPKQNKPYSNDGRPQHAIPLRETKLPRLANCDVDAAGPK